jgi:hypothetical protein
MPKGHEFSTGDFMKIILFVAIGFGVICFVAIASLGAHETSVDWKLTETLSYDDYRGGKLLTFHGKSDETFLRPDINDFRLERLAPTMTWIPLLFGRDYDLDWPADAKLKNVRLYLKCPGSLDQKWRAESGMQLYAQTWIEPNASYRMTWTRRHSERRTTELEIEFQVEGDVEAADEYPSFPQQAYLCEVLYEADGIQFLGRTVLPSPLSEDRRYVLPAVGFTKEGTPVDPPDPGYKGLKRGLQNVVRIDRLQPKPLLAMTTHYLGFSLEDHSATVRVSDVGTWMQLPHEADKPNFVMFSDNLYRIELLTKNIEVLRQDQDFWEQRIGQIRAEWAKDPARIADGIQKDD